MILEIIATNIRDVKAVSSGGADRIELCTGMKEEGFTPSYGLIESAVEAADIPINVLIRSHSQSFVFDSDEVDTMVRDIRMVKKLGANGVVIGALTEESAVDVDVMKRLLEAAEGLDVTFHRASDFSRNVEETVEVVLQFPQIKRILTAGGRRPAPESIDILKRLMKKTEGTHATIMPGYGIREQSLQTLIDEVKPKEIHIGSGVRVNDSYMESIDEEKLRRVKTICSNKP